MTHSLVFSNKLHKQAHSDTAKHLVTYAPHAVTLCVHNEGIPQQDRKSSAVLFSADRFYHGSNCDTDSAILLIQCLLIYDKEEVTETGIQVTLETSPKCSV